MFGIVFLVILVIIAVMLVGMYNTLVQMRVRCDSAWSDIDVQLKRRHDLIPNLVETVKGYAAHEKGTFENIAKYPLAGHAGDHARRQSRGRESAYRSVEEPVCRGGELSRVEGVGTIHEAAGLVEPD